MDDETEVVPLDRTAPRLGETDALLLSQHIALTGGAVDEDALQTIVVEHPGIGGDDLGIDLLRSCILIRCKRGYQQPFDLSKLSHIDIKELN